MSWQRLKSLDSLAQPFVKFVDKCYPDAFLFVIILTFITFLLSLSFTDSSSVEIINAWYTSDKTKPTDAQLNALSSQATALENTATIDGKRQVEYLSWQEQMEMIYKDQKNGTTTYKDHCDKVRSDNPKE